MVDACVYVRGHFLVETFRNFGDFLTLKTIANAILFKYVGSKVIIIAKIPI